MYRADPKQRLDRRPKDRCFGPSGSVRSAIWHDDAELWPSVDAEAAYWRKPLEMTVARPAERD
jgi:hypothetical protein